MGPQHTREIDPLPSLIAGRREVLRNIDRLKANLREAVIQLDHLEATMRMFDPDIDFRSLGARKELPADPAQHGETMRIVLAALVDAGRPLSTASLIEQIISARGLDRTDAKLRQKLSKRLGPSLRYAERVRGLIRSLPGPGQMNMWELIR
jgi:hypothetical protein